jgi:hypothetical protein
VKSRCKWQNIIGVVTNWPDAVQTATAIFAADWAI